MRELPSLNPLPLQSQELNTAASDVADYAGTPPMRAVDTLLELLEADYLQQLRTVSREELQRLQGVLAQTTALRDLIHGRGGDGRA